MKLENRYHLSIKTRKEAEKMKTKERIMSLKLIGKKQSYEKFLEEIGVTAVMKEKDGNLENETKEKVLERKLWKITHQTR